MNDSCNPTKYLIDICDYVDKVFFALIFHVVAKCVIDLEEERESEARKRRISEGKEGRNV